MEFLICNKCFAPMYRGKRPYSITQCGHIFCQNCLLLAEKKCPQCNYIGAAHIPLTEPLSSKIAPFFTPITDTLEMLIKVEIFRSNQMKIMVQRFNNIEKKYDALKGQFWTMSRNIKVLNEKYQKEKAEKNSMSKKLLFYEMQRNVSHTPRVRTPTDSDIFKHPSSAGYSTESYKSSNITPSQSINSNKYLNNSGDSRISNIPSEVLLGSMHIFSGSDKSLNHRFKS